MDEPNYQMLFESAVRAKQNAYDEYKTYLIKYINASWIGNDGNLCYLRTNYQERLAEAKENLKRASIDVEQYRMKKELHWNVSD